MTNRRAASAIVLCGGGSARMGLDKSSLPFGGERLLDRVVRIVASQLDDVVVAAGASQLVPPGWTVVRDPVPGHGPLPALRRALSRVRRDRAFVVACDTPLLQAALVPMLLDYASGWEACVPRIGTVQMPACAVYETASAMREAELLVTTPSAGLGALVSRLRTRFVGPGELADADPELLSFIPCNTPEEYRHALRLAHLTATGPSDAAV